ncbi:MAG: reverse transcriptase [Alphaproteobacteria bacterium]|nr:reverse transcriptase [Alphaproteobacteria bacterium]
MFEQAFSERNFRKIFDQENRKGRYLEAEFFPSIVDVSERIQKARRLRRTFKKGKAALTEVQKVELTKLKKKIEALEAERELKITEELEKVSALAQSGDFKFSIKEIDVGLGKTTYTIDKEVASFFAIKQIQANLQRVYKVKQANRQQIVSQVSKLIADQFPKYILRTDITSFYESIPTKNIMHKLDEDGLLSVRTRKLIKQLLHSYQELSGAVCGLPRGIGISAYLAELYMRKFDTMLRSATGVIYYSRYVDDLFLVLSPPPNKSVLPDVRRIIQAFKRGGLHRNRDKTSLFDITKGFKPVKFDFLGYCFTLDANAKIELTMTAAKKKRYEDRIDRVFADYLKKSKYDEKRARRLLVERVKFLTGNTRLVNNKKNVVAGIYFSNSLLHSDGFPDLKALDLHLSKKASGLSNAALANKITKHTFVDGFQTRRYHKFSATKLAEIVRVWKHG